MVGIDERISLGTREFTTLRQLANQGRLMLRGTEPRKKLWAEVANPLDPNGTEAFEISQNTFDELLDLGVLEATARS
jgi:hypothetical protein